MRLYSIKEALNEQKKTADSRTFSLCRTVAQAISGSIIELLCVLFVLFVLIVQYQNRVLMAAAANLLPVSYIGVLDYRVRFSSRSLFRLASGCSKHCLDAEVAVRVHPNLSSRLRNREKATFCPVKNAVCFRTVQLYNDLVFSNFLIVRFLLNPFLVSQFAFFDRKAFVNCPVSLSSFILLFSPREWPSESSCESPASFRCIKFDNHFESVERCFLLGRILIFEEEFWFSFLMKISIKFWIEFWSDFWIKVLVRNFERNFYLQRPQSSDHSFTIIPRQRDGQILANKLAKSSYFFYTLKANMQSLRS